MSDNLFVYAVTIGIPGQEGYVIGEIYTKEEDAEKKAAELRANYAKRNNDPRIVGVEPFTVE